MKFNTQVVQLEYEYFYYRNKVTVARHTPGEIVQEDTSSDFVGRIGW
jgi:hypothetical protein